MKALVVLLARLSTGLFLILWAYAVHADLRGAADLVTSLSQGVFADSAYRMALVYGAGALGLLTILGLARRLVYPLQALAVAVAAAAVWKSLADPLGLFFFAPSETNMLFFPMLGLFVASLVPLCLREEDAIVFDGLLRAGRKKEAGVSGYISAKDKSQTEMAALVAAVHESAVPHPVPAAHAEPKKGGQEAHGHAPHTPDLHGPANGRAAVH